MKSNVPLDLYSTSLSSTASFLGHIPGLKCDDVKVLPCETKAITTKQHVCIVRYGTLHENVESATAIPVTSFRRLLMVVFGYLGDFCKYIQVTYISRRQFDLY